MQANDHNIVVTEVAVTNRIGRPSNSGSNDSLPELSHPEHSPALRECSTLRGAK